MSARRARTAARAPWAGWSDEELLELPLRALRLSIEGSPVEKRVDRMLNLMVRLMEPILLLALAGVVLFIFVALVVPMPSVSLM